MAANPLSIAPKSQLLEAKARTAFQKLIQQYKQGSIKTKIELMSKLFNALRTYYATIGQPILKVRQAKGLPNSTDYNTMMNETHDDLTTLYAELALISSALQESFTYVENDRQAFTESLLRLQNQLHDLETLINASGTEIVFREPFLDRSLFDTEIVEGTLANVNLQAHALTLNVTENNQINTEVVLRILSNSNGFPGNTHQVHAINGRYKFYGEDNLHFDLNQILDGNADTWFEYETFQLNDETMAQVNYLGFDYKEGISWVKAQSEPLRLVLEAELPTAQTINWLSLTPFLAAERGAIPPRVVSIKIDDGKGSTNEIVQQETFHDVVSLFPRQKVKRLTIWLEQEVPYETLVGHTYFKEVNQNHVNFFEKQQSAITRRIEGTQPSIETLGFQYDPSTQTIVQPNNTIILSDATVINELFDPPTVTGQIETGLEALPAQRYAIGIRDLSIANYKFATESTYISKPFTTQNPIRTVTIDVDEWVPKEFGLQDWINYYISVDGGRQYWQIWPSSVMNQDTKIKYLIGVRTPLEARSNRIGYLDTIDQATTIRVKIVLKRPENGTDIEYLTPILKEYRLNIVTEGGYINER